MTQTVNFEGNRGECKEGYFTVTSRASMAPNETASVNGGSPEQSIIANDDAKVFAIALQKIAGIYDYQVRVEAQGPSGAFSGSMYLAFERRVRRHLLSVDLLLETAMAHRLVQQ